MLPGHRRGMTTWNNVADAYALLFGAVCAGISDLLLDDAEIPGGTRDKPSGRGVALMTKTGEIVTGVNAFHFLGGPCAEITALANHADDPVVAVAGTRPR